MAQFRDSNVISSKSEREFLGNELDHIPLIRRRRRLLFISMNRNSKPKSKTSPKVDDVVARKENECSNCQGVALSPFDCFVKEEIDQPLTLEQSHVSCDVNLGVASGRELTDFGAVGRFSQDVDSARDCNSQHTQASTCVSSDDVGKLEIVNVSVHTSPQDPMPLIPAEVKVESSDSELLSSLGDGMNSSAGSDVPAIIVNNDILRDPTDNELDHIVLKERQRMLLRRKLLAKPVPEVDSTQMVQKSRGHSAKRTKVGVHSIDGKSLVAQNQFNDTSERNACHGIIAESYHNDNPYLPEPGHTLETKPTESRNDMEESDKICSSKTMPVNFNSQNMLEYVPTTSMNRMQSSAIPTSVQVKVESVDDNNGLHNADWNALGGFSFKSLKVKSEPGVPYELNGDGMDHMQLLDRMKLLSSGNDSKLNNSGSFEYLRKVMPPADEVNPSIPEFVEPTWVSRLRKRKKTVTDSVETAMEEDAPGLLRVLVDQGVSVDEIKLYGEPEDDAPDEPLNEDSFAELEAVMSKLFSQRTSFLKFAPVRCTNGSKPSYCLACLFSLVEQARYLQFRKWPVEWGWCRDLQSFIFVFERHNRIVLERPEYGYATYFFELVDSLPVDWQIKRLVTAMRLSHCGRITLIENKPLLVGEDLTDGEAKVLMEYGWTPNTGLGTMLNYRDRVVHDRKNEKDTSEWRSKIGKLLIDGYNGGSIVCPNVPKKVMDCQDAENPEIKLEL